MGICNPDTQTVKKVVSYLSDYWGSYPTYIYMNFVNKKKQQKFPLPLSETSQNILLNIFYPHDHTQFCT